MANDTLRRAEDLMHEVSGMSRDELLQHCRLVVEMEEMLEALTTPSTAEPATEPSVVITTLEESTPTATDEPEPAAIFQTGPDVLERVLERQSMQPHRQAYYTAVQDRFRRRR